MDRITVVVPVYNGEKHIEITLKSLLAQEFSNFEIIVVDDGSTDETRKKVQSIFQRDKRKDVNKVLICLENSGVSIARNIGFSNAKGKYVIFIDSDDLMNKNCLRELYNKANTLNLDIVLCGYDLVDKNAKTIRKYCENYNYMRGIFSGISAIPRLLKKEISVCTGSQLFSSSLIIDNNLKFTPGATHGEDQEFSLKALYYAKRVSFVQKSLVKYVQRKDSATKKKSMQHFHYVGSMKRAINFFEERDAFSEIILLMESYKLPEAYINSINSLIYSGFSFKFIRKEILGNKIILKELRNYVQRQNTIKEKIKEFLLKRYPTMYFWLQEIRRFLKA